MGNDLPKRQKARVSRADRSHSTADRHKRGTRERGASTINVLVGIVVLAIVATVLVVVAARNNDDDTTKTENTATATGPETGATTPGSTTRPVVRGGTMVSSTTSTAGVLNPATTSNGGVHTNGEAMFNGLLAFDTNDNVVPDLAANLPTVTDNSDGTQDALFTLRSGMKWHNGAPITADDVVFSFTQSLLRYHSRTAASMGPALGVQGAGNRATTPADAITMPDGPTGLRVKFHFLFPYAPLLKQMNVTEAPIIPKNVYAHCAVDGGDSTLGNQTAPFCAENLQPVGSGPFKWASTTPTQITMDRNPTYFKTNLPYLDRLVLLVTATPDIALQAAREQPGSVDAGLPIPGNKVGSFNGNSSFVIERIPRGTGGGNCITTLAFNLWQSGETAAAINAKPAGAPYTHPILSNLAVRKAIYEGFDRQTAFTNIEFGEGRAADSPLHSATKDLYAPQSLPGFSVTQARADLQAAGWLDPSNGSDPTTTRKSDGRAGLPPAGTELKIDTLHFDTGTQVQYGLAFQANMKQVGIAVTDRPQSNAQVQTELGARTYDTAFVSFCAGDDPVVGTRRQYVSSQISTTPFTNVSGYRNARMDDLWKQAIQANASTAKSVYAEIQKLAVADLPQIWVTETLNVRVSRSICHDLNNKNTGLFAETAWCG
jgi:peptide/nickel transport system substrate-binding protein